MTVVYITLQEDSNIGWLSNEVVEFEDNLCYGCSFSSNSATIQ